MNSQATRNLATRLVCCSIALLFPFVLSSCSYLYVFPISGLVFSENGQPLAGVKIILNRGEDDENFQSANFESKADGTFSHEMKISPGDFSGDRLPIRFLWLSKDGYVKTKVNVSPPRRPNEPNERIPIKVEVVLKHSVPEQ